MVAEHDFSGGAKAWELRVFKAAITFKVSRFMGAGTYENHEFDNFPDALTKAQQMEHFQPQEKPCLIYALTEAGRYVCLDRKQWDDLIGIWSEENA